MKLLRQQFLHLAAGVAGWAAFPAIAQDEAERASSAAGSAKNVLFQATGRGRSALLTTSLLPSLVSITSYLAERAALAK
jgi:hypothetical protein